jgi:hypothetical protein
VTVGNIAATTAPDADDQAVSANIYRTSSGTSGNAEYLLVTSGPTIGTNYVDSVTTDNLGEVLVTEGFYPAPNLRFACYHPNGFLVGGRENLIAMSELGYLYAWPPDYEQSIEDSFQACCVVNQTDVLIVTNGSPYILTGGSPASSSLRKLASNLGCIRWHTLQSFGDFAVYASHKGLVKIDPNGAHLITQDIFTQEQWEAFGTTAVDATAWGHLYVFSHPTGMFIIDPLNPEAGVVTYDESPSCWYYHKSNDGLYYADSSNIYRFDSPTWKTGEHRLPKPGNLAVAKVHADDYTNCVFKLYADGVLVHTENVADAKPFRLPGDYIAERIQCEVSNDDRVSRIAIAQDMLELQEI